jgi:hypothetical protein
MAVASHTQEKIVEGYLPGCFLCGIGGSQGPDGDGPPAADLSGEGLARARRRDWEPDRTAVYGSEASASPR